MKASTRRGIGGGMAILVVVALLVVGAGRTGSGPLAHLAAPVDLEAAEVTLDHPVARVRGTAHYPARVTITFPERLFSAQQQAWVFPVFPDGDTIARDIRVLAISPVQPDPLLGFQDLEVTGRVLKPTSRRISRDLLEVFHRHGYSFADDFVLLDLRGWTEVLSAP